MLLSSYTYAAHRSIMLLSFENYNVNYYRSLPPPPCYCPRFWPTFHYTLKICEIHPESAERVYCWCRIGCNNYLLLPYSCGAPTFHRSLFVLKYVLFRWLESNMNTPRGESCRRCNQSISKTKYLSEHIEAGRAGAGSYLAVDASQNYTYVKRENAQMIRTFILYVIRSSGVRVLSKPHQNY